MAMTQFVVRMWPSAGEELASAFSSSWEGTESGAESLLVLTNSQHYSAKALRNILASYRGRGSCVGHKIPLEPPNPRNEKKAGFSSLEEPLASGA